MRSLEILQRLISLSSDRYRWVFAGIGIAEVLAAIDIVEQLLQRLASLKSLQRLVSLSSDWYRWVFATIVVAEVFAASGNAGQRSVCDWYSWEFCSD